ncbi:MAG: hypothetical protein AABZ30_00370 [Myxococcota bacterium]
MKRTLSAALAVLASAPALAYDLEWKVDGYYRTRAYYIRNLANQQEQTPLFIDPDGPGGKNGHVEWNDPAVAVDRIRESSFLLQRARLEPRLELEKIVKFQLTIDALDDLVWGDNNAQSVAPLFAVNPTNTDYQGQTIDPVQLKRAWVEFGIPVGLMRVGRIPSHWGMGLLANGGGTSGCSGPRTDPRQPGACLDPFFDDDFGDNHFASVNDRILFATRPLQVYRTIRKAKDPSSNFVLAYAYDKLVEDYMNIPLERQLRARADEDFASGSPPGTPDSSRGYGEAAFLGRPDDDVQQHVIVLLYNDTELDRFRLTDELRGGVYMVFRNQPESRFVCQNTDEDTGAETEESLPNCDATPGNIELVGDGSSVQIYDLWYRLRLDWFYGETEFYTIRGNTDGGIPLGSEETLKKEAAIYGLASRWGYESPKFDGIFEFGHSSGDTDLADAKFTQRPMHPDYNVGLLMYEEVIRELTARTIGRLGGLGTYVHSSSSLQSNGGVINSTYINPRVRYRPLDFVELVGGFLAAWWDETGMLPKPVLNDPALPNSGKRDPDTFIGWEIDAAAKVWWADNTMSFTLEGAYFRFGDGLRDAFRNGDEAPSLYPGAKAASTIQSRVSFVF